MESTVFEKIEPSQPENEKSPGDRPRQASPSPTDEEIGHAAHDLLGELLGSKRDREKPFSVKEIDELADRLEAKVRQQQAAAAEARAARQRRVDALAAAMKGIPGLDHYDVVSAMMAAMGCTTVVACGTWEEARQDGSERATQVFDAVAGNKLEALGLVAALYESMREKFSKHRKPA